MNSDALVALAYLGIPSAVTALCFGLLKARIDRREKQQDAREKAREKNEVLLVRSVGASIALGEAAALALQSGKCNGETEKALAFAREVRQEQKDFLTEQGIKNLY